MSEILRTNVCCLDLSQDCVDYFKSLDLNVYEGSLGSVFSIDWGSATYGSMPVKCDVDYPENLHEYHIFIHDMENPHHRNYVLPEHQITVVRSRDTLHFECFCPINSFDLRPFGLTRLAADFERLNKHKRIEILFVGREEKVTYQTNDVSGLHPNTLGPFSNIKDWHLISGENKCGQRVKVLEENGLSKLLFEGRNNHVKYCRVFSLPTVFENKTRVIDKRYISLLQNESGECISYLFSESDDFVRIVLPQVEDKVGLLKDLFENVLFKYYSCYFPDFEAHSWINNDSYMLPDELEIKNKIRAKRFELEREIIKLEEEETAIREQNLHLKQLLTETGDELVKAVKTYLEWLGFENVIDKDETVEEGAVLEEDLCLDYEGKHLVLEVKGINGTSTDSECSQVDKIVNRRMYQLDTTKIHGIYIVNNQKNVEPLKRTMPPFNETQIKDAVAMRRTMAYTAQLFSLYSDIENGYVSKEQARACFLLPGLVDFHSGLTSLGVPYSYFHEDTVLCLELNGVQVTVGEWLYYKDELSKLVGCKIKSIQQDKITIESASRGKVGIEVENKVPRNREIFK